MKKAPAIKLFIGFLFLFSAANGQTGGAFSITESVVAGGGQNSAGGNFALDGTIGQAAAGNALNNAPFTLTSGFWNFAPLAPTAAQVSIGGRVRSADGSGIRNVLIVLTAPNGATRTATSSTFGYYSFEDIPAGEIYIITVYSKRFTFSQPTVVRTVLDSVADLDFIADPV